MANVADIVIRVRQRVGDMAKTKFSDEELLGYLNDAINFLSAELISLRDAEMVKVFTVVHGETGTAVPADYFSFVGEYPIYFESDDAGSTKVYPLDSSAVSDIKVRYFAYKPKVDAMDDTIPFNNVLYYTILSQFTAMYALNRNTAGGQDAQLFDQIRAQIRAGKGSVAG